MKKILLFVIAFCSLFLLVSCKKNEAVGRTMENFLSDYKLESDTQYKMYEEMCKTPGVTNRYKNTGVLNFSFKTIRKVSIKSISFTIYNYSETDSFYIYKLSDNFYQELDGGYYINVLDDDNFDTSEIKRVEPNSSVDIKLDFEDLLINGKKNITLNFGILANAEYYDGLDTLTEVVNLLKTTMGRANFNVEYKAYL